MLCCDEGIGEESFGVREGDGFGEIGWIDER